MSGASPAEGFTAFFMRWEARVRLVANGLLASEADVDDVVQVVFSRLWMSGRWRNLTAPGSYLGRAAASEATRLARREGRIRSLDDDANIGVPAASPDQIVSLIREESWHRLEPILGALPPSQRDVIRLTIIDGMTRREAAERVGSTLEALEKRVTRAYRALRASPKSDELRQVLSTLVDGGG